MDVWIFRGLTFLFLISGIACSNKKTSETVFPQQKSQACLEQELKTEFIVQWEDGRISLEKYKNKEEFITQFIEPNLEQIKFAETNSPIYLHDYDVKEKIQATASLYDWGLYDTHADYAWKLGYYGQNVRVAVIDSGVDVNHPALSQRIAYNPGEIPNNGIDDDKNGYVDDYYGFDFGQKNGDVKVILDHGTHVAGIIAADHTGQAKGVAPDSLIIPLNFFTQSEDPNEHPWATVGDAILAIDYAVHKRNARLINASWGGGICSQALKNIMASVEQNGVLFIVASGNEGANIDLTPAYPASFGLSNQITVGALSTSSGQVSFSNYGVNSVNLLAPGEQIWSTIPKQQYAFLSGTSMATPFVTGAAALLWSYKPQASVQQIKQALLQGVDTGPYNVSSQGTLNIQKAFLALDQIVN